MSDYVLKIDCPDEKGLVHRISGILYHHGLNMMENDEFVDRDSSHFFMRAVFSGNLNIPRVRKEVEAILPENANMVLISRKPKNIVVLATKEYHCLGDLLMRHHFGELNAHINAVISNHETLSDFTRRFDIPYHCIPTDGLKKEEHEAMLIEEIKKIKPDYIVLAKYMRIFTPFFTSKFPGRIINIHHSFLPAFVGARPYQQAYERGVKMIGATAHFVNENLDEGPIIRQDVSYVNHKFDGQGMSKAGKDVERLVLSQALKVILDDRVFIHGNKTVVLE
ncbi:MAG: formyltetrahydrofolate deformylase [Cyclobacteriaceae bacterium]